MSRVTNVVVIGYAATDSPPPIRIVDDEREQSLNHVPEGLWGGTKHPETNVWVAALNYVDDDQVARSVRAYNHFWAKGQVLVVVEGEADAMPRVLEL